MLDGNHYIECECNSDEHVLRYTFDLEDKIIYTSVFLRHWRPWYQRVWIAIKYIFGYKCKYGHFDCTSMGPDEVEQLRRVIQTFQTAIQPPRRVHSCDIEGCAVCDPTYGL